QRAQLLCDIRVHAVMARPRLRSGVEIEAGADAEVPGVTVTRQLDAARTRVRRHEHQPELGGDALRARLDHEGLLRARQPGEIVEHRYRSGLRLRGSEYGKAHGARGARRLVPIEADRAAEAAVLTDHLEGLAGHGVSLSSAGSGHRARPSAPRAKARFFARGSATCGGGARPCAWASGRYRFMGKLYAAPAEESPRTHCAARQCHVSGTGWKRQRPPVYSAAALVSTDGFSLRCTVSGAPSQPPPSARYNWTRSAETAVAASASDISFCSSVRSASSTSMKLATPL